MTALRLTRHEAARSTRRSLQPVERGSQSMHPAWVAERERRAAHEMALLRQRRDAEVVERVWAKLQPGPCWSPPGPRR